MTKNKREQPYSSRNAWVYLANNGPTPTNELPNKPTVTDRQDGVQKFNIQAGATHGGGFSGGGQKSGIYYIREKHSKKAVIEAWLEANEKTVKQNNSWSLHQACPESFRPALKDVIDVTQPERENIGGAHEKGGECPACGQEYTRQLPDHLPECSELAE
jgi:hypothetical protein